MTSRELVPETCANRCPDTSDHRIVVAPNIPEKLRAYYTDRGEHDRDLSWEFCYKYFHPAKPEAITANRDHAALQLGFYLASWGMYRNSFLLDYSYTVHLGVVDRLLESNFSKLWQTNLAQATRMQNASPDPGGMRRCPSGVPSVCKRKGQDCDKRTCDKGRSRYYGLLPRSGYVFQRRWKHRGFSVPGRLNSAFIQNMLRFCRNNLQDFQAEQARIEQMYQMPCPLMKLVDAYFHQIGWELNGKPRQRRRRRL